MAAPSLAPREELMKELKRRCGWVKELDSMSEYVYPFARCKSYVNSLLKEYSELVFADFDEVSAESVKRVIDACNRDVPLLHFAPAIDGVIEGLRRAAEKDREEDIEELARQLERMTLAEFLEVWEDVMDDLRAYEHYDEVDELYVLLDYEGRLTKLLEREIREIAMKKRRMTEKEVREMMKRLEC